MTFGQATPTTNTTATRINNIDSLLATRKWASNTVTFSFTDSFFNDYESGYSNSSNHSSSFESLNDTQREVARSWFDMYEDVSNLSPVELTGASDRDATMRLAESNDPGTAYAYTPNGSVEAGDMWFNRDSYNNPTIGAYSFRSIGHEIGHALGLEHGHEANGVSNVPMDSNRDSMEFSIMTYRSYIGKPVGGGYTNEQWGYSQSLMMYDIAAIQQMYGANFNTNSGNTTYSFSTTTGEMFVNGVGQGTPGGNRIFRTVWDGNGIDTYNFSNYSTNLDINITPGNWTNLDIDGNFQTANLGDGNYARGHVFNALQYDGDSRSLIENAVGGSGNDIIIGNNADNNLSGLNGNDYLEGGFGFDTIDGGAGNDTVSLSHTDVGFTWDMNTDQLNIADGTETIRNVENVVGSQGDDRIIGDALDNRIEGLAGNDYIAGGLGFDTIDGGAGDDTVSLSHTDVGFTWDMNTDRLDIADGTEIVRNVENVVGSGGDDRIVTNRVNNIIEGAAGADTFVFSSFDGSVDTIKDFNYGQGDRLEISGFGSGGGFGYDENTGNMFFNDEQFALLENQPSFSDVADGTIFV